MPQCQFAFETAALDHPVRAKISFPSRFPHTRLVSYKKRRKPRWQPFVTVKGAKGVARRAPFMAITYTDRRAAVAQWQNLKIKQRRPRRVSRRAGQTAVGVTKQAASSSGALYAEHIRARPSSVVAGSIAMFTRRAASLETARGAVRKQAEDLRAQTSLGPFAFGNIIIASPGCSGVITFIQKCDHLCKAAMLVRIVG